VTVVITDTDGNATATGNATAKSTIYLGNGSLTITGGNVSATAGMDTGKVVVATFTDSGNPAVGKGYRTYINWGDSTKPSVATVVTNTDGSFSVVGQHGYAQPGKYPVPVTVYREGAAAVTGMGMAQGAAGMPLVGVQ